MMTEQQLDARLTHIEEQAAAMQERVDGFRDQEMAKAFLASEWSQEQLAGYLAKRWDKDVSPDWVAKHLRLGRFLRFFNTTCIEKDWKIPRNLTEGAFRGFWEQTEAGGEFGGRGANTPAARKDEKRRFAEVAEMIKEPKRKPLQKIISQEFGGKPGSVSAEEIRQRLEQILGEPVLMANLVVCLRRWSVSAKNPFRLERIGETFESSKYRIIKVKGAIVSKRQMTTRTAELIPLLDDLIKEARKDRVEISLTHLVTVAGKIKSILESMTAKVPQEKPSLF